MQVLKQTTRPSAHVVSDPFHRSSIPLCSSVLSSVSLPLKPWPGVMRASGYIKSRHVSISHVSHVIIFNFVEFYVDAVRMRMTYFVLTCLQRLVFVLF